MLWYLNGVSQSTISKLRLRYRDTHDVEDRPKVGVHVLPQTRVDRSIGMATLSNRRITPRSLQMRYLGRHSRRVYVHTIRNRLHASQLQSRKAAQKPLLAPGVTNEFIDDLRVICGSILALRDFGKVLMDPTSLLWAVYFVVITIL